MGKRIKNLIGKVVTEGRATLESVPSAVASLKAGRRAVLSRLSAFVLSVKLPPSPALGSKAVNSEQDGSDRDRPDRFFDLIPLTWATQGCDPGGRDLMLDGRAGRRVLRSFAPVLWFKDGGVLTDSGRPLLIWRGDPLPYASDALTHVMRRGSTRPFLSRGNSAIFIVRDPAPIGDLRSLRRSL